MSKRSSALLLRFFSLSSNAPNMNDTSTLPRLIIETTATSAPSCANAEK